MAYNKEEIHKRVKEAVRSEIGQSLNPTTLKRLTDKAAKAFISEFDRIKREWDIKCKFSDEDNSKLKVTATLK